jgi:molybdenum cofactor cytidylyltransferase
MVDAVAARDRPGRPAAAIVPIVLAAGASTRMGRTKALCDFDGRTCIELVLQACREAGLATPIVVLGFHADEVREAASSADATFVTNDRAERGQTSSLKIGLAAMPFAASAFVLYPVDLPLVTGEDLARLVSTWRARRSTGTRIVIPSHGHRRGHPVLFDVTLRDAFLGLPDDAPAHWVVGAYAEAIAYVDVDTPYVLMDMDTPAAYAQCLATYRRRNAPRRDAGSART